MDKTTILIADDHLPFRVGLRALLDAVPDIELVGARTGSEAIIQAGKLQPDVIIMDLQMPDVTGIEATRRILAYQSSHRYFGHYHV